MPATTPLSSNDEISEETLELRLPLDLDVRALLREAMPTVTRGAPGKPRGLGDQKVSCAASVSEAIIEDRG